MYSTEKLFERKEIKKEFNEIFEDNAEIINKQYLSILDCLSDIFVKNIKELSKENILNKVKELTKEHIVDYVLSKALDIEATTNTEETTSIRKLTQKFLLEENDAIISFILNQAMYSAFRSALRSINGRIDSVLTIHDYYNAHGNIN